MKVATGLSFIGLLASTIFAAPSQHQKKDVNIFVYEQAPVINSKSSEITSAGLESGRYIITSPGLADDEVIGRYVAEDRSLLPKRILTESKSLPPQVYMWSVRSLPNGKFSLSTGGAEVKNINGRLFAILLDHGDEWIINPRWDGLFTIEDGNGLVWVAGTDDLSQVEVRPGNGSPQSLFRFTRVDENWSQQKNEHESAALSMPKDVEVPKAISQGRLPPGAYTITSPILPPDLSIGRAYREDLSLLPKRILTTPTNYAQSWRIQSLESGNYRLIAGRDPVTNIDGKIFAVLLDIPEPREWYLISRGPDTFTIEDGEGNAWVASPEESEQVVLAPLRNPIPPNQLFKFTPLDDGYAATSTKMSNIDIKLIVQEL
jgi:hypothetical protein